MTRVRDLRVGVLGFNVPGVAGIVLAGLAAVPMLIGPPTWATVLLAGAATLLLGLDRRLGWLPAGLLVLLALPFGRGADVLAVSLGSWPVRPPDAILTVALFGSLLQLRHSWGTGIRREPILLAGFLALAGLGLVALVIGFTEGHSFRDILRDARFWALYLAGGLALMGMIRRAQVIRALLLGGALFALIVVVMAALPAFEGGLKWQALVYDRETLRAQYGNSVFLLPGIAICFHSLLRRFSPTVLVLLTLLLAATVLSLTRMSIAAAGGVVALSVLIAIWQARSAMLEPRVAGRLLGTLTGCVAGAAIAVVLSVAQHGTSITPQGAAGEDPVQRILGRSEQSSIEEIVTSPSGRLASYREAIGIIREAPLLGAGFGRLIPVEFAYSPARAHVVGMQPGVDNTYLTFGVKAGVFGVALIAGLLLWPLLALFLMGRSVKIRPWFVAGWLAVLALTVTQGFASSGYSPYGVALLIALPSLRWVPRSNTQRTRW